jgi:uncharacterized membrane protein
MELEWPLLALLVISLVLGLPVAALIVATASLLRARRLESLAQRVQRLESQLAGLLERFRAEAPPATAEFPAPPPEPAPAQPVPGRVSPPVAPAAEPSPAVTAVATAQAQPVIAALVAEPGESLPPGDAVQWELFLGRKALGWAAVAALVFAAAFFLRHAFQQWIGPQGQVMFGATLAAALMLAGWYYFRHGWLRFSQMFSAAGIVVLYLAVYSAFGFYQLLPQQAAFVFLVLVVIESALLAVAYNGWPLALVAIIGGLLTPVLLRSEHDRYIVLFCYLLALNCGVVLLMAARRWVALGLVSLLGTQGLFWLWYYANYHFEKLYWALGFQAGMLLLYLGYDVLAPRRRTAALDWQALVRPVLEAAFWLLAAYTLLVEDYGDWLSSGALMMAGLYTVLGYVEVRRRQLAFHRVELMLAIAAGFIAIAIPIQAERTATEVEWIGLGWAAQAAVMWWFGLRVKAGGLRALAAVLAVLAIGRALGELPWGARQEFFVPVVNQVALPLVGILGFLLVGVIAGRRLIGRLHHLEQKATYTAFLLLIAGVWLVLSLDLHSFFHTLNRLDVHVAWFVLEGVDWLLLGQMTLSVFWALFASGLLVLGFVRRHAGLRWLAIGLFGLTVAKVFLVDMAALERIYRILAFFALAVLLGLAARAYQRIRFDLQGANQVPRAGKQD